MSGLVLFVFGVLNEEGPLGAASLGSFVGTIVVVAGASEVSTLGEGDAKGGTVFGGHKGV